MTDPCKLGMRLAVGQVNELTEEHLLFTRQCGLTDILMNTPKLAGDERWEYEDLARLVERADSFGVRLVCIENVPIRYYKDIMLGGPARDRQLQNMQATVRNMGRAGIPILGYHWMPNGVWRTERQLAIRGGALSNSFNLSMAERLPNTEDREYAASEMWDNYHWYMERMLPVCEEAGVRMALHPDDPPVPMLGGVARIFGSFDGFRRAMECHASPMHGLDFCHGCWSEMRAGEGILEAIERFGPQGEIFYVHMRDVQGCAEDFRECFVDEGNSNILAVLRKLREVGFRGFIIDDHVPHLVNDSPYRHRSRAYALGYLKALLSVVNSE